MISVDPKLHSLFLDVDGTLADIRENPTEVAAPSGLLETLSPLTNLFGGAVAIVSGRHIRDIDRILAPLQPIAAGVHGIQLRTEPGGQIETTAPKLPAELLASIHERLTGLDGIVIEPKDEAVAIHYRLAPQFRDAVARNLRELVAEYGRQLEVSQGRMVYEIVPRSCSKGQALKRISQLTPFARRHPVMIGDDAPDVSAMTIAAELGGFGLTVGGEFFPEINADFRGPGAVRDWLRRLVEKHAGI